MLSPYAAVYGYDTTYIRRMTVGEYQQELEEEEADLRGQGPSSNASHPACSPEKATPVSTYGKSQQEHGRVTRQYEQRRFALSSRNPNVVFSSKYPMHDRLGRELCVAHQMQDMAVQQELRRWEREEGRGCGEDSRRSGVRLSAEVLMESDGTTTTATLSRPGSASQTLPPSPAEAREEAFSEEASQLARPSHIGGGVDSVGDIEVSATSQYPSVSDSRFSSRPASARPSEFSIFRDSGAATAVAGRGGGVAKARSTIPVRAVAEEDGILIHRRADVGGPRANSMPSTSTATTLSVAAPLHASEAEGRRSDWQRRSEKRHRSRSSGGRQSRVRFLNEDADDETTNGHQQRQHLPAAAALPRLPPRQPTPPPVPLSDPYPAHTTAETTAAAAEEATRWTALPRGSAAVRATKQLFRATTHSSNASRVTTTLAYGQPIPSNLYGLSATSIAVSKVCDVVEQNVDVCAAAMPHLYTQGSVRSADGEQTETTPELRGGDVVQLGTAWYRLVHFHAVAEVYEAVRVEAPPSRTKQEETTQAVEVVAMSAVGDEQARGTSEAATTAQSGVAATKECCPQQIAETPERRELVSLTACEAPLPTLTASETSSPITPAHASTFPPQQQQQQFFIYSWRTTSLPRGADEARRAALGLSLSAPQVHVTGFHYADGGGLTLVSMPVGYHAVPLSSLPLSLRSYTTVLRLVLKALSAMVARRTVHGSLLALGDLFLVWRVDDAVRTPERSALSADAPGGSSFDPFVVCFHWERWVDFGMFLDRNAGRTLPFDYQDGAAQSSVFYTKDLLTGLQLFLEHALAAELTSEQYILLQKLIVIASEPTQIATYLIQLKNLMLTLPADPAVLQRCFEAALVRSTE